MSATQVGQQLRQAREAAGLSLADVSRTTRIRSRFLQALEEGNFGELPSAAAVRGFLRTYAEALGLDPQVLFDLLQPKTAAELEVAAAKEPSPAEEAIPPAFAELGAELRQRRESLELTLPEIESSTRISEAYLQRLEAGDFDSFPSPSQARGLLGNYADFLGLESGAFLLRYADALQASFQARQAAIPLKQRRPQAQMVFRPPTWLTSLFSRDLLVGGLTGVLLLVFVVWSIGQVLSTRAAEKPQPTAPSLAGLLLATDEVPSASPTVGSTPGLINLLGNQVTATPGLLGQATFDVGLGAVNLRLVSLQRTWMRVTVDGQVQFEGRTTPGQQLSYSAGNQVELLTGNGAALRAFLNDQDLGTLGIYGEVIDVIFSRQGAATPTLSPTPTIAPEILTSTANAALTPSATPTPTTTPTPEPSSTVDSSSTTP